MGYSEGSMRLWGPKEGTEPVLAVRECFLESRTRILLVERVTEDIAIRVTTIQKAQSNKQQARLWVGCLRVESRKKQGGEANGPNPARQEVHDGGV